MAAFAHQPSTTGVGELTIMKSSAATGLIAVAALAGGSVAQSFTGSCKVDTVKVEGRWLTAQCHNILGTEAKCTKLDLNNCLKNNYGRLEDDVFGTG